MDSKGEDAIAPVADVKRRLSTVVNNTFEESDWNSIVMECKSLSAKWEKLSIYLGLPPDKIDTIKRDNHDAENRWSQALLAWIRQGYETKKYGKPSWRTLLRAIAEENKHLFDKLSQSHLMLTKSWSEPANPTSNGQSQVLQSSAVRQSSLQQDPVQLNICEIQSPDGRIEAGDKYDGHGDAYEVFRCPCGQCSLESYLEDGCPKSNSNSFPYLDVSNLNEDDREDLTHQLSQDTSEMITSFAKLLDEICVSLAERAVSVQRVKMRALSLGAYESQTIQKPLLNEDEMELKSAKTIDEVFILLRPHMSFFNFELLKHITDCKILCSDGDRESMAEYVGKFDAFCKRKVFEVPPGDAGQPTPNLKKHKRKTFAVLMTEHEAEPNLVFVNAAKRKIATLLKLKPSTLHLHRIDKGSLIFVFSVPNFVARKLFPLKPSVVAKLKDEGFLIFSTPPATDLPEQVILDISSAYEKQHRSDRNPRKRAYASQNPIAKTNECGLFKLVGECRYGDSCQFQHAEERSNTVCCSMSLPKGRAKLNKPYLSPDNKFYIAVQDDETVMPFNEVSKGDFTKKAELTREQAISSESELKFSSGIDVTEASGTLQQQQTGVSSERLPHIKVKIIAEDSATLEYAKTSLSKLSSIPGHTTRLRYVYVHPEGMEEPDLYLTFKKSDDTAATKNMHELFKERLPGKDTSATNKSTVESFAHLINSSPINLVSISPKQKTQPVVQVRKDYMQDISQKMRECLTQSGSTPKLTARFGRIVYQKKIREDRFDAGAFVQFAVDNKAFQGAAFVPEINTVDIDALKKSLLTQVPSKSEIYTVTLKAGREEMRVDIKFKSDGSPEVTSMNGKGPYELSFDIVCLHRKYDMRLKLSTVEKPFTSIQGFISSTLKQPEPGVIIYSPTLMHRWAVTYIRLQKTEQYEYRDSNYVVKSSAVGEHVLKNQTHHPLSCQDFKFHDEISVHKMNHQVYSPSWDTSAFPSQSWSPDTFIEVFEKGSFMKTMDDLNETLELTLTSIR